MRELRLLIEGGDAEGVRTALAYEPGLANRPIRWFLNQENQPSLGTSATVALLVAHGASLEATSSESGATPLFWAVHGYGPNGPKLKMDQVGAARVLIEAGARAETANKRGLSALELFKLCERRDMYEMLYQSLASAGPHGS